LARAAHRNPADTKLTAVSSTPRVEKARGWCCEFSASFARADRRRPTEQKLRETWTTTSPDRKPGPPAATNDTDGIRFQRRPANVELAGFEKRETRPEQECGNEAYAGTDRQKLANRFHREDAWRLRREAGKEQHQGVAAPVRQGEAHQQRREPRGIRPSVKSCLHQPATARANRKADGQFMTAREGTLPAADCRHSPKR